MGVGSKVRVEVRRQLDGGPSTCGSWGPNTQCEGARSASSTLSTSAACSGIANGPTLNTLPYNLVFSSDNRPWRSFMLTPGVNLFNCCSTVQPGHTRAVVSLLIEHFSSHTFPVSCNIFYAFVTNGNSLV